MHTTPVRRRLDPRSLERSLGHQNRDVGWAKQKKSRDLGIKDDDVEGNDSLVAVYSILTSPLGRRAGRNATDHRGPRRNLQLSQGRLRYYWCLRSVVTYPGFVWCRV